MLSEKKESDYMGIRKRQNTWYRRQVRYRNGTFGRVKRKKRR